MKISWEINIKTVSEANSSEHWKKKSERHRSQQFFVRQSYMKHVHDLTLPCEVTLTRLSSRKLDKDENLPMSFKWIKDEISECIFPEKRKYYIAKNGKMRHIKGRADDNPQVKWHYAQEKASIQGIRIEISF